MIDLNIKLEGFERAMRRHDPMIVRRAARSAINDTTKQARTSASKAIRTKFNLKAKDVNAEVKQVRVTSVNDLEGVILANGRPINLTKFGAKGVRGRAVTSRSGTRQTKRASGRRGVYVTVERGRNRHHPNAFVARGRRGSVDGAGTMRVFQRADLDNNKSHLIAKASITIASMMMQEHVIKAVGTTVSAAWSRRFDYQLSRMIK